MISFPVIPCETRPLRINMQHAPQPTVLIGHPRPTSSRMTSRAFYRLIACFVLIWACGPAAAQFSRVHTPESPAPGSRINIAATWDGRSTLHGIDVQLGQGMNLVDIHVLRFGRDAVSAQRTRENGTSRIELQEGRALPHEIILTVDLPSTGILPEWRITPLQKGGDGKLGPSSAYELQGTIPMVSVRNNPDDLSLDLGTSGPVLLRADKLPNISYDSPFEIGFWIRTTSLNEVLLSTWNGDENLAYPLEVEIGPNGRLTVFRGHGRMHESITTRRPVADGAWHEVRINFDGERLLLVVDGMEADSLNTSYTARIQPRSFLAIGGRVVDGNVADRPFSGFLDDLTIRVENSQAFQTDQAANSVHLSFDSPIDPALLVRAGGHPEYATSDRAQVLPPGSLRAEVFGSGLQLSWEGSAVLGGFFVVERSQDRQHFEQIGIVEILDTEEAAVTFDFIDGNAGTGVQYYRVVHETPDGSRMFSRAMKVGLSTESQESVELIGNFPNPFSFSTTIAFRLAQSQNVELSVWDLSGQRLATLVDGVIAEGRHEVQFQADDLPSGTYFLRLQTPNRSVSRKMILTK